MRRFFSQIISVLKGLTRTQKIIIGIAAVVVIGILIFFSQYTAKVEYVDLYVNIDPEEAGKITKKLDEWKQSYKLEGTTIKVPLADRDRLRLKLASAKLAPRGGIVGFEIFDTTKLAITDYERRINYLRALQGELTRTIESIEGIEDAKVLLVLPEKKLYIDEEKPVTASVKLTLDPYTTLSSGQIVGIVELVAAAVEGLEPENVMVVDNKGNILTDIEELKKGQTTGLAAKQLELQRAEGRKLERKIRKALAKCLSPDKVEVVVTYHINFDKVESREEKYSSPENIKLTDERIREGIEKIQLKVSDEKITERFEGEGSIPGGPPGIEAQMPGYKGMTSVRGPMTYSKDEIRSNYLANKKEILTVRSPKTSKISVAVWIDGTYERDERGFYKLDENNRLIYIPRSEEEMRKYENLVWASIGAEKGKKYKDREYIVRVENVQFDRTAEWLEAIARKEAEKRRKEMERRARLAIGIGAGFLAFAILMVILFMLMIRRKTLQEERLLREKELAAALKAKEEEEKEKEEFVAPPAAPPVEEEVAPPEVKEEVLPEVPPVEAVEEEEEPLESLAIDLAKTKPEVVARLLRTWIEEEEEVGVGG